MSTKDDLSNKKDIGYQSEITPRNKAEVRIHGKEYTLKGIESEEYMQKVAHYIDKKMADISKNSVRMSTAATAILTAVNVADDYFKFEQVVDDLKKGLDEKTKELENCKDELNKLKMKNTQIQLEFAKAKSETEDKKKNNR